MIFISAAAAVFLVSKFKEIDWAKACVVLPDEEHEHERYFLSEPPKKIVHAETSQGMVRSVCAFNFLLSRPLLERLTITKDCTYCLNSPWLSIC